MFPKHQTVVKVSGAPYGIQDRIIQHDPNTGRLDIFIDPGKGDTLQCEDCLETFENTEIGRRVLGAHECQVG